jgi:hypothetical protein
MKKYGKLKKKGFWSTDLLRKLHGHGVQRSPSTLTTFRVTKCFLQNMGFMNIYKKYQLKLVTKGK